MNRKDDTKFTIPEIIVLLLMVGIIICSVIGNWMITKDYRTEVTANLVHKELVVQERNIIGYANTYHQTNAPVYDKPYTPSYYMTTYEYEQDGKIYKFSKKCYSEPHESIIIKLLKGDPAKFIIDSDYLGFTESVSGYDTKIIEVRSSDAIIQ